MGRNDGHQRGDSVAAYGELSMAAVKSHAGAVRTVDAELADHR